MPLDLGLVSGEQVRGALLSFLSLFLLAAITLKLQPSLLKRSFSSPKRAVMNVGILLTLVVVIGTCLSIQGLSLRIGLISGAAVIVIIGTWDEKKKLSPATQFVAQLAAVILVVVAGWTIPYVSNPLGEGVINLDFLSTGRWLIPGSFFAVIWLLLLMNAVNWLDGVDGLAASVSLVTLVTLAAISILPQTRDDSTVRLALIGAGAICAFLFWNWFPARVYLGTTGSWFLGLYVGLVAMIGGGKIATTILVLAFPLIDVAVVSMQRIAAGKSPWQGDRERHLHFRLLSHGITPPQLCVGAFLITALLGIATVSLQTYQKLFVFALLLLIMGSIGVGLLLPPKLTKVK